MPSTGAAQMSTGMLVVLWCAVALASAWSYPSMYHVMPVVVGTSLYLT